MLQHLTSETGASAWAIASMLFFIAVFAVVMVRLWFATPAELEARAHMALDDDPPQNPDDELLSGQEPVQG